MPDPTTVPAYWPLADRHIDQHHALVVAAARLRKVVPTITASSVDIDGQRRYSLTIPATGAEHDLAVEVLDAMGVDSLRIMDPMIAPGLRYLARQLVELAAAINVEADRLIPGDTYPPVQETP